MKKSTLIIALLSFLPILTLAKEVTYTPMVGIPGLETGFNFDTFINSLYWLSISIASLLAVIKIIIAGVKWMLTEIVTSKEEAKKDIEGALIGLLIVLGAVLILNVINPQLTKVNFNPERVVAPPVVVPSSPTLPAPAPPTSPGGPSP